MTSEEAVAELANKCFIFKPLPQILTIVEAVKATETRRCAQMAQDHQCRELAFELLRTGGLEAEE